MWDYDAEEINSARKLIRVLTKRFGGTEQADKYRLEVKYRRRKLGEDRRGIGSPKGAANRRQWTRKGPEAR